nr:LacI family DNA-binding transcriptional regulator [Rubellimicrobium arenae]
MKDVALRAGVSTATVSNVLTGRKAVRPELRELVQKAVEELDYRTDPAASFLRSGRSRIIAAVVPSLENPFFASILATIERLSQQDGYELIVASSEESPAIERARIRSLVQWKPAGFVVLPNSADLPGREDIEAAGIPLIVADREPEGPACDLVAIDNFGAGAAVGRHLMDLGHRSLAVCAPFLAVRNIQERIAGVAQVAAEVGASLVQIETGSGGTLGVLPDSAEASLSGVTAVIALTNTTTLQILAALTRAGRSVPGNVSLVGFDDYPWMLVARPSVTAVRQPVGAMGGSIWARLQERIGGASDPPSRRTHTAELILRESTAPPSGGVPVRPRSRRAAISES